MNHSKANICHATHPWLPTAWRYKVDTKHQDDSVLHGPGAGNRWPWSTTPCARPRSWSVRWWRSFGCARCQWHRPHPPKRIWGSIWKETPQGRKRRIWNSIGLPIYCIVMCLKKKKVTPPRWSRSLPILSPPLPSFDQVVEPEKSVSAPRLGAANATGAPPSRQRSPHDSTNRWWWWSLTNPARKSGFRPPHLPSILQRKRKNTLNQRQKSWKQ